MYEFICTYVSMYACMYVHNIMVIYMYAYIFNDLMGKLLGFYILR